MKLYFFRYRDKDPEMIEFEPPCEHKDGRFKCCSIPVYHLIRNRKLVYMHANKTQQDRILASMMTVSSPKRRHPRKESEKLNTLSTKYQVRVNSEGVPVCSKFFLESSLVQEQPDLIALLPHKQLVNPFLTEEEGTIKLNIMLQRKSVY